jgi:hypothetical protein
MLEKLVAEFGRADLLTPHGVRRVTIVSDLQGTFLDHANRPKQRFLRAWLLAQRAGHEMVLCSDAKPQISEMLQNTMRKAYVPSILNAMNLGAAEQKQIVEGVNVLRSPDVGRRYSSTSEEWIDVFFDDKGHKNAPPNTKLVIVPETPAWDHFIEEVTNKPHQDMARLLANLGGQEGGTLMDVIWDRILRP